MLAVIIGMAMVAFGIFFWSESNNENLGQLIVIAMGLLIISPTLFTFLVIAGCLYGVSRI